MIHYFHWRYIFAKLFFCGCSDKKQVLHENQCTRWRWQYPVWCQDLRNYTVTNRCRHLISKCGYLRIKYIYFSIYVYYFFHVPSMILGHGYSLSVWILLFSGWLLGLFVCLFILTEIIRVLLTIKFENFLF